MTVLTIGTPLVHCWYSLGRPVTISTPMVLSVFDDWYNVPVGRADSMCLHGRPCVWLPFAAACGYTLFYQLMVPAARLVCQRPSSNFPYFRTPLANFLLSRPNSVEYCNSKTTTLLPSAKCTRPLFQGRTGCDGRPSGWHDIVTCQRLVYLFFYGRLILRPW